MLIFQRTPTHRTLLCSDLRSFPQIIRSQFQNCKFISVSILLIVVHIKEEGPNICFRLIILHRIALSNNLQVFKICFMLIILRRTPKSPTRVILLISFPQLFEDNFKTLKFFSVSLHQMRVPTFILR